ncbi:hypothetical protein [Psychrobacter sp. WY6]|uniref:hypothetical protein n=1 Tax=Psychrobacter sp. WY6 TaxID=2708350 RepID=UPI002022C8A2|nr:hypothetical protein [Psychrobacter sp. WY6]
MWEKQRAQLLATIKSKKGQLKSLMSKSAEEGRTTDDDEEAKVKAVEDDIARLEANLARVESFIADVAVASNNATPAAGESEEEAGASAEGESEPEKAAKGETSVKPNNAKKGIAFAQLAKAKALAVLQQRKVIFLLRLISHKAWTHELSKHLRKQWFLIRLTLAL